MCCLANNDVNFQHAVHILAHIPDQLLDFGPASEIWEFSLESLLGWLVRAGAKQRASVAAAIFNRYIFTSGVEILKACIEFESRLPRTLPKPPVAVVHGTRLSSRSLNAAEIQLIRAWVMQNMSEAWGDLKDLHGQEDGVWDWLTGLDGPTAQQLEGLSAEAKEIAGGISPNIERYGTARVR